MSRSRATDDAEDSSSPCKTASLFPLHLSAFENYMFVDDRPSHPMVFVIAIEVSGELRVDALQQSIVIGLQRHPLLSARIARRPRGRCWVPDHRPPTMEVVEGPVPLPDDAGPIDLRVQPGLRVWIVPESDGGRILFQFHHAATDGLGAMQYIGDVLVEYARRTAEVGQELPEPRPVDLEALRTRGCLQSPNVAGRENPWSRAKAFFRQLGRSASRLAVPPVSVHDEADSLRMLPPFVSRTLDREFVKGIKQSAARRLLHVNDLYVATMFKSVHDWNQKYGEADDGRVLRLSVPTSLRTPQHDLCPAANVVNMVFVNRAESDCGDVAALLGRAGEVMNASTHDRVFYRAMRWARCVPGLMELSSRLPYSFATMVMTNVGDVKRQFGTRFPLSRGRCVAGSITIEGLRGNAPLRPGTHVGISAGTYAGQLFINASCDPHLYTRAHADEFLDLFLDQLGGLAASDSVRRAA